MTKADVGDLIHWLVYDQKRTVSSDGEARCLLFMGWMSAKYDSDPNAPLWHDLSEFKTAMTTPVAR